MKKILFLLLLAFSFTTTFAQTDVTKFLGFPVDGTKSEMIKNLESKGFELKTFDDNEFLSGRFNGKDVEVFISTENGKVSRILVCDENTMNESDIKIRFNKLCQQFKDNGKYLALKDYTIPDSENISQQMVIYNKRYEAVFYQLPEGEAMEQLQAAILLQVQSKYSPEQLENLTDEIKNEIYSDTFDALVDSIKNKPVWFMISGHMGKYYISMFYDNELNRAHGEDL